MECAYGCGEEAKYQLKNGKACCSKSPCSCVVNRAKNASGLKKAHAEGKMRFDQFDGKRGWRKGKTMYSDSRIHGNVKPDQIFTTSSEMTNARLKKIIRSENLFPYQCECGITDEWRGRKIVLELDHVNGCGNDNRLENLRFLCPNCHSQTETFRGRNKNMGKAKVSDEELSLALTETSNIRQALIAVGLVPKGANYERAKRLYSMIKPMEDVMRL